MRQSAKPPRYRARKFTINGLRKYSRQTGGNYEYDTERQAFYSLLAQFALSLEDEYASPARINELWEAVHRLAPVVAKQYRMPSNYPTAA